MHTSNGNSVMLTTDKVTISVSLAGLVKLKEEDAPEAGAVAEESVGILCKLE
jgi:hypothetical protein